MAELEGRDKQEQELLAVVQDGTQPVLERVRAGDGLAAMGDPRFDPERWFLPGDTALGFVRIPAGKFIMGYRDGQGKPPHEVDLPDYWMGRYPVTVAQFRAFVQAEGYDFNRWKRNEIANHPVVEVTWFDALAYCTWLGKHLQAWAGTVKRGTDSVDENLDALADGLVKGLLRVSLPSEVEWEKAARGTDGREYPWKGDFDSSKANTNETRHEQDFYGISAVGCFPNGESPYGVLDMAGNVWEWTRSVDEYPGFKFPYKPGKYDNLERPKVGFSYENRVIRGSAYDGHGSYARCAFRYRSDPERGSHNIGFRLVITSLPLS